MTKKEAQRNAALNGGRGSGRVFELTSEIIADLKKENRLLGERCNQLLKDKGNLTDELQELKETLAQTVENDEVAYETLKLHDQEEIGMLNSKVTELENKIADIKANCDLAIEGRDVKIKELELELTVEKDQHQEEINLHLHAEDYIKSLEKENKTLEGCLLAEQEHTQMLEQQIEKMKKYGKLLQDICTVMGNNPYMISVGLENRVKVLWNSSVEKEGLKMVKDIENRLLKIKPQDWAEIEKWEIKENE